MNGELMNMVQLTLSAKHYIRTGKNEKSLAANAQIDKMTFSFVQQDFGKMASAYEAESRDEWLKMLAERGAEDIKLIVVDEIDNFDRLAFANSIPCFMLCFYDGGITSWNKRWTFNNETKKWDVHFTETICRNTPPGKPQFSDVSQQMVKLFERLRALSQKLGLSEFSMRFAAAQGALQANFVNGDATSPANRRLLQAAVEAYVFGGEGSWNDKAKFIAAGKGLSEEYQNLTKDLYRGIALSCMYAVNEW